MLGAHSHQGKRGGAPSMRLGMHAQCAQHTRLLDVHASTCVHSRAHACARVQPWERAHLGMRCYKRAVLGARASGYGMHSSGVTLLGSHSASTSCVLLGALS